MSNCIKVLYDGRFCLLDLDLESWQDICTALDQSGFEIVRTPELRHEFDDNVVMLIGDCSAVNGSEYNEFASRFYSGPGIYGDAIFCIEEGPELVPLRNIDLVACWFEGEFDLERLED